MMFPAMKRLAPIELRFPSHVWWQSWVNLPWKSPRDEMWITMNHHWSALWTINSSIMMMVNYSLWWTVIYTIYISIPSHISHYESPFVENPWPRAQGMPRCWAVGCLMMESTLSSWIIYHIYVSIHPSIDLSIHASIHMYTYMILYVIYDYDQG